MFTVRINTVSVDKKGNKVYETALNSEGKPLAVVMTQFDETVAEKARLKAKEIEGSVSMYVDRLEEVPQGYRAKVLEFSVQIWKSEPKTAEEALETFA